MEIAEEQVIKTPTWHRIVKREGLHIAAALFTLWTTVLAVDDRFTDVPLSLGLLFAITCTICTLQCYSPFAAANPLRTLPGTTELIGIFLSVPVGALFAYGSMNLLLHFSLTSSVASDLWLILTVSAAGANIAFLAELCLGVLLALSGVKRRVILDLLPEQENTLRQILHSSGLDEEVELLPRPLLHQMLRVDQRAIDFLIISKEAVREFDDQGDLIRSHLAGIPVLDGCHVCTQLSKKVTLPLTDPWAFLHDALPQTLSRRAYRGTKVVFEPLLAGIMLILAAPIMLAVAALIRLSSPGPIFYRQTRLGYRGETFTLIKFRTMRVDAEQNGPRWADDKDSRVTGIGGLLRRTRLDELPQLLNVIQGEMSFVGPRPERPEIAEKLQEDIPLFRLRTIVRPGITGWAQVKSGYAASVEESHLKLEYDLYYIQNMSLLLDLHIITRTVVVAFLGDGKGRKIRKIIPLLRSKYHGLSKYLFATFGGSRKYAESHQKR